MPECLLDVGNGQPQNAAVLLGDTVGQAQPSGATNAVSDKLVGVSSDALAVSFLTNRGGRTTHPSAVLSLAAEWDHEQTANIKDYFDTQGSELAGGWPLMLDHHSLIIPWAKLRSRVVGRCWCIFSA